LHYRFDDHCRLKIEDARQPKQVKTTRTLAELLVIEGVLVRLPGNQRDIEIARNARAGAESLQLTSLDRRRYNAHSNLIEGLGKLTEAVVGFTSIGEPRQRT